MRASLDSIRVDGEQIGRQVVSFQITCTDETQCATIQYISESGFQRVITVELGAISFGD